MTAQYIGSISFGDELEDSHLFPDDGLRALVAEDHLVRVHGDYAARLRERHVYVAACAHAKRLEVVPAHRQPELLVIVSRRRTQVQLVSCTQTQQCL